jgi:three-Cys-motif partner protein
MLGNYSVGEHRACGPQFDCLGRRGVAKHEFGGDWTTDKLERVRKYLCAYTTIFLGNRRARYYTTTYVDAFAGTGHRADAERAEAGAGLFEPEPDSDREAYKKGSARIALEVEPPFDRFIFIERAAARAADLQQLAAEFAPQPNAVTIVQGEANGFLREWCEATDWSRHRAVVFLDPYGMQVEWATLEALAGTQAVDLWYLFPLGVAVNRLLTRSGPPPEQWSNLLTRIFGTPGWQAPFYPTHHQNTLFGVQSVQEKDVNLDQIGKFFVERLKTIFSKVAGNPLPLRNSTNTPIYLLCFAAANPKGASLAVKIAQDILRP